MEELFGDLALQLPGVAGVHVVGLDVDEAVKHDREQDVEDDELQQRREEVVVQHREHLRSSARLSDIRTAAEAVCHIPA